ncbi:MAG TPA: arylesterase [Bryobacteraceae bacterium]|jgi:acyl-CoA thioesterase-1|nr:arylesterase [Bryobacteraceae bacterium]
MWTLARHPKQRRLLPLKTIVAICVCATFTASSCGTKPSPSESASTVSETPAPSSPPPAPPEASPDRRPVIVTFGDSLTQGVAGKSYPADLQDLLDQRGYHYRVDNQGVSGDTTTDGLARIDNVIAVHPALVVLEFGGNDGLRGVPVQSSKANLDEMIARLKSARLRIVLAGITLPPNYGPEYVQPFTAMFPELAKKYNLPLMPFLLVHVYRGPNLMQPDGIHPNGNGNKIVAEDVFNMIRPFLKK